MTDEQTAIAELETPAIEQEAPPEVPAEEPQAIPAPGEEEPVAEIPEVPEIELVEIEWEDGQKYQIPKAIEGGILRNKDYTQKRQTDAEFRKKLESREAEINQRAEATEAELDARAELRSLDKRLSEYAKLTSQDWAFHRAQDPLGTDNAWTEYQLLKEQRGEIAKTLETTQAERTAKTEQDLATRVQETIAFAQKEIPGWKPELTDTLVKFALDNGVPEATIKANWSPVFYKLLHRAHIGELAMHKTAPTLPTTPVQPLKKVGGNGSPNSPVDLASADMDAYIAARKKGVGGKPLR